MPRNRTTTAPEPTRILVVEDNLQLLALLREVLVQKGYAVQAARNGVEAMAALSAPKHECPDAVLLDVGLPLENGVSVLQFLRRVMRSRAPVVVLTGRDDPEDRETLMRLGVSAYLTKPTPTEELLRALSRALA